VPGESTSSISECIDVLPYHVVYVYPTTSMNSVHQAHVQSELDAGRIQLLTKDFKEVTKNPQSKKSSACSKMKCNSVECLLKKQTKNGVTDGKLSSINVMGKRAN
jgi:hypothetical protein